MRKIEGLRRKVDEVDEKIVEAISERTRLSRLIGAEKKRLGMPIVDEMRERKVYEHAFREARKRGLDPAMVERVFDAIIEFSKRVQGTFKIGYLGPKGSFTMEAAEKYFSKKPCVFQTYPTIRSVFKGVEGGEVDYGVVPVENSLEGSVSETLDSLASSNLKVVGEEILRISLHLSSKARSLEEVRVVFSNPHALAQARPMLDRILPNVKIKEVSSTSVAAAMAARVSSGASICSEAAAMEYGLRILARDLQGEREDYTRFLMLARDVIGRFDGPARTMLMMGLEHKPGVLYRALGVFARLGINLTRIESRPVKDKPWEYRFLVEFEGGTWEKKVSKALERLKRRTMELKVLGSYRPAKNVTQR